MSGAADEAQAAAVASAALGVLREVFGFPHFRGLQQDVVEHVSGGGDALVLMPTGGGKSLCYQVPAIVRQNAGLGTTVVVSPLIALMHDQVGALREAGVSADFLNSTLDSAQTQAVEAALRRGEVTLLYVAPERLLTPRLLALLDFLHERGELALFAIDEAHCVSQWGHDFRPEYRGLAELIGRYSGVPRVALTATADALTREDIVERLGLEQARRFVASFDRPNIHYTIVEKNDPTRQLLRFIAQEHPGEAGIVYAQSRRRVDELAETLRAHGLPALAYHAGMDANQRQRHQDRFLREEGLVMVATIAFGMGIDKPDVRFVAHIDAPKNIEGYYQETGRAGRDGAPAHAWMAYGLQDVVQQRRMIDDSPAQDAFKQVLRDKLDALLALAETMGCRRVRLLQYFGETPPGGPAWRCGHCDNCTDPPVPWDASEPARKLISCMLRVHQASGLAFGAGHLIDILRGQAGPKVLQHGHERLSTFGIGADLSETQWRSVLRQLVAIDAVQVSPGEFRTLEPGPAARAVLRGETSVVLRAAQAPAAGPRRAERGGRSRPTSKSPQTSKPEDAALDAPAQTRLAALKHWRADVARAHQLPAFVIFHDSTLRALAVQAPQSLEGLSHISGIGQRKLEAYGQDLLAVIASQTTEGLA